MSWQMRRRVEFGFGPGGMTQRSDGSWQTHFIARCLDDEPMPITQADLEAFVRRDVDPDPVLRGVADAATAGLTDPLERAVAATRALHGHAHPSAAAWRAKRNVSKNDQAGRHPDQVQFQQA